MKLNFRRITSSDSYIPQVDGLRFIAIFLVVLYHLKNFLVNKYKFSFQEESKSLIIENLLSLGYLGVPIFFIISGFVLARPFVEMYINKGQNVVLKNYYLKRLTRIEPPYIIVMTILLIACVWIAKTLPMNEAIKSYFSSLFYLHNIIYGKEVLPLINNVAWSLEIEVQFYLLMPLVAMIFKIGKTNTRNIAFIFSIVAFKVFSNYSQLPFISLLDYLSYFLIGMMIADQYLRQSIPPFGSKSYKVLLSVLSFILLFYLEYLLIHSKYDAFVLGLLQIVAMYCFTYLVIVKKAIIVLSNSVITSIGGICYSIYLLHPTIISFFGNPLMEIKFSNHYNINQLLYGIILTGLTLFVSALFFLLVEQPTMKKDWYKIKKTEGLNNVIRKSPKVP